MQDRTLTALKSNKSWFQSAARQAADNLVCTAYKSASETNCILIYVLKRLTSNTLCQLKKPGKACSVCVHSEASKGTLHVGSSPGAQPCRAVTHLRSAQLSTILFGNEFVKGICQDHRIQSHIYVSDCWDTGQDPFTFPYPTAGMTSPPKTPKPYFAGGCFIVVVLIWSAGRSRTSREKKCFTFSVHFWHRFRYDQLHAVYFFLIINLF